MTREDGARFDLRRADNGYVYLHWFDGRRSRRQTTSTKDLAEAKIFLSRWLAGRPQSANVGPTCAELWAAYMSGRVERKCVNAERHRYAWRALEARFGALRPADVTHDTIEKHLAARLPTKPSTVFVELRLLTASWNFAVKRRLIPPTSVPILDDLDLPTLPPPRERWLQKDEVERLFKAAAKIRDQRGERRLLRVERFMWIALATAARRTAILELRWTQVDFETRVIHLNPAGRVQTSKRRASVPISDALLRILKRAYAERTNDFVLDHSSRLHDALDLIAERAGVKGVTAHVFRHTAATWMARAGTPLWKIAKILGNSVEEIERTYAKHCPDDLREAVNLLGSLAEQPD